MPHPPNPDRTIGLRCGNCGCADLRVEKTQPLRNGLVRRYRRCRHCKRQLVTLEGIRPK